MALQKTITSKFGIDAVDAYHRVERVMLVAKNRLTFRVRVYANTNCPPVMDHGFQCEYDMAGDNPIRQAYLHLKTLPDLADAVDC
jgi:hypothetical protein